MDQGIRKLIDISILQIRQAAGKALFSTESISQKGVFLKKVLKKAKKVLKKYADGDWRKAIKEEVNKDSVVCLVQGPYLCKKGENKYIDTKKFKGEVAKTLRKYSMYDVVGKMKKQPTSYIDVKSKVINDYTQQAEKLWIESLRKKYQDRVIIYQEVLETLK
jgi:peptidyl-prolyl cis-trans isomerase SurA